MGVKKWRKKWGRHPTILPKGVWDRLLRIVHQIDPSARIIPAKFRLGRKKRNLETEIRGSNTLIKVSGKWGLQKLRIDCFNAAAAKAIALHLNNTFGYVSMKS